MHEAKVRLERHTHAKISPSWSRLAIHESNCRTRERDRESRAGVENPSTCMPRSTTKNSSNYTGSTEPYNRYGAKLVLIPNQLIRLIYQETARNKPTVSSTSSNRFVPHA